MARKRWICWPTFDKICLEGGCTKCAGGEEKTANTIFQQMKELGLNGTIDMHRQRVL